MARRGKLTISRDGLSPLPSDSCSWGSDLTAPKKDSHCEILFLSQRKRPTPNQNKKMKIITISRKRTLKINLPTSESLRELLTARQGYSTFIATLETNGNGGMLSDISDIIEADEADQHLDNYEVTTFKYSDLRDHVADSGGELCDGDEWIAFDCNHEDGQGYLTGSVSRIYVNLAI